MSHNSIHAKRIAGAALLGLAATVTQIGVAAPAQAECVWNPTVLRTFCTDDNAPPPPPPQQIACDNIGPGGTSVCNHDIWLRDFGSGGTAGWAPWP